MFIHDDICTTELMWLDVHFFSKMLDVYYDVTWINDPFNTSAQSFTDAILTYCAA